MKYDEGDWILLYIGSDYNCDTLDCYDPTAPL